MSSYPEGIKAFCEKHSIDKSEIWSAHGTWVVKHSAIERVAAANGITFDMPQVIEANSANKVAVVAVAGRMGELSEWSFGEASPANNKNAYPFAMAEKRAKDRVALKLLGAHGVLYSEEEAESFKQPAQKVDAPQTTGTGRRTPDAPTDARGELEHTQEHVALTKLVRAQKTLDDLNELITTDRFNEFKEAAPFLAGQLRGEIKAQMTAIKAIANVVAA